MHSCLKRALHNVEMSGQIQVNELKFFGFLRMTVKQQGNNTMTSWEREASAKGQAFYDSTFNHPFFWILNRRLSILIFHWTTGCWSLERSDTLVGVTVFLLPLPVCLGFLPPGPGPPITLQVLPVRPGGLHAARVCLYPSDREVSCPACCGPVCWAASTARGFVVFSSLGKG